MRGQLITLEALDGVGKSTAIETVLNTLAFHDIDVLSTREPGGTHRAEAIRSLLLDPEPKEALCADAELLLMSAARAQHLQEKIRPALEAGTWIVSDRFHDSMRVYQGDGRGIPHNRISILEDFVLQGLQPDLTILLDLPEAAARERRQKRIATTGEQADRFELEADAFFRRVRHGYLSRAEQFPDRFVVINAAEPLAAVQEQVRACVRDFCNGLVSAQKGLRCHG